MCRCHDAEHGSAGQVWLRALACPSRRQRPGSGPLCLASPAPAHRCESAQPLTRITTAGKTGAGRPVQSLVRVALEGRALRPPGSSSGSRTWLPWTVITGARVASPSICSPKTSHCVPKPLRCRTGPASAQRDRVREPRGQPCITGGRCMALAGTACRPRCVLETPADALSGRLCTRALDPGRCWGSSLVASGRGCSLGAEGECRAASTQETGPRPRGGRLPGIGEVPIKEGHVRPICELRHQLRHAQRAALHHGRRCSASMSRQAWTGQASTSAAQALSPGRRQQHHDAWLWTACRLSAVNPALHKGQPRSGHVCVPEPALAKHRSGAAITPACLVPTTCRIRELCGLMS